MNWRNPVYLSYASKRGYTFPSLLKKYRREYSSGNAADITTSALRRLLAHCRENVPYYAERLREISSQDLSQEDPGTWLKQLPILTKQTIREQYQELQSKDNGRRDCQVNTSGGSTGEPVRLVQDAEYRDHSSALSWLCFELMGCRLGQPTARLWGSERDLEQGTKSRKARFFNWLTNTTWLNAFQMSPEKNRASIELLNRMRPQLILAYAQAAYELAKFAEQEGIELVPQRAVLTSAGTLYPFMREKIARVFGCKVHNLYGSREVGDIAWELPGTEGLWVAPWGNYVEIVDDDGQEVTAGTEGNIVVTCLANYAMPLIRYAIGDRGSLLPGSGSRGAQVLRHVSGRTVDVFRTRNQTLVDGEYFTHLLYFRPWVWKFQVVQKAHERVLFKIVTSNGRPPNQELEEIAQRSRLAMGDDCQIDFEFPKELPASASGKFRYTISEVAA